MKQSKLMTVILLLAWVAAACTSPTPTPLPATPTTAPPPPTQAPQEVSWQNVQQAGKLRVGTTADYPPFEYYNEKTELDGFDIALIKQIAQKLNLQVEISNFAFEDLPMAVAIGQVDVAIGALSVTPERQEIANFSNVYYAGSDAVLSRPEADPNRIKDPASLAVARLGVQVNSIYAAYAQEKLLDAGLMPKENLSIYVDTAQAVSELKAGHIDAIWMDLGPAQRFVSGGGVKILAQDLNQQLYAIGMKKGADALRDKINEALTQLQNDGTLANLQVQYLGLKPEEVVTPQPLPTPIAQPTAAPVGCLDGAQWVKDLSLDDKYHTQPPVLNPGQIFSKGWQMKNSGTCTWKIGYSLATASVNVPSAYMNGQPIQVTREVKPGETYDFWVNLIAPVVPGHYIANWVMNNALHEWFGQQVWVDIHVAGGPTLTPKPTLPPDPNIYFVADPKKITKGEAVVFEWNTDQAKYVYFYHDGQDYRAYPVEDDDRVTVYPSGSMYYYLRVVQKSGEVYEPYVWIDVKPAPVGAPVIEYISATPPSVVVPLCTRIDWSVKGEVDLVNLSVDGRIVRPETALVGHYEDCPTAGIHDYVLEAIGPGGIDRDSTQVSVMGTPVTQAPVTEAPTEAPTTQVPTEAPVTEAPPPTEAPTEAPTEPPPTEAPTEAPTEPPTEVPTEPVIELPVIQGFDVIPPSIGPGACVTAAWTVGGGTTGVELWRNADMIAASPDMTGSAMDCPLTDGVSIIQYTLVAYNNNGDRISADRTVEVVPAPVQIQLACTGRELQAV